MLEATIQQLRSQGANTEMQYQTDIQRARVQISSLEEQVAELNEQLETERRDFSMQSTMLQSQLKVLQTVDTVMFMFMILGNGSKEQVNVIRARCIC